MTQIGEGMAGREACAKVQFVSLERELYITIWYYIMLFAHLFYNHKELPGFIMPEVIFENKLRNLLIRRKSTYDANFLALLERTIWGSEGLTYTINNISEILNRIEHPHFLALEKDGQLIGALTLIHKANRLGGKDYPAFYSYGLAIEATREAKGMELF